MLCSLHIPGYIFLSYEVGHQKNSIHQPIVGHQSKKNNKKNPMTWPPPLSATVPLLLQLLQAAVMAVPAHRREPSPGEDASSRPSGCRGGRAGGGRGRLREPRPGLEARGLQTHLWRVRQDGLRYRALPGCFHPAHVFSLVFRAHPSASR